MYVQGFDWKIVEQSSEVQTPRVFIFFHEMSYQAIYYNLIVSDTEKSVHLRGFFLKPTRKGFRLNKHLKEHLKLPLI